MNDRFHLLVIGLAGLLCALLLPSSVQVRALTVALTGLFLVARLLDARRPVLFDAVAADAVEVEPRAVQEPAPPPDAPASLAPHAPLAAMRLAAMGGVFLGTFLHGASWPLVGFAAWAVALPALALGAADPEATPAWWSSRGMRLGLLLWSAVFVVLLPPFWKTPSTLYNWEEYPVAALLGGYRGEYQGSPVDTDGPLLYFPMELLEASLPFTQGLMTDSHRVLLGGTPIAGSMWLFGPHLLSVRLYSVVTALLAVGLMIWFGRLLAPARPGAALLASVLLAATPAFLVYGRTGTDVGPTVTWALVLAGLFARLLWLESRRPRTAFALGAAVCLSGYFYAVIRLQAAAIVVWLVLAVVLRRFKLRIRVLPVFAAGFLLFFLPQTLFLDQVRQNLFEGRGEQLIAMSGDRGQVQQAYPGRQIAEPVSLEHRLGFIRWYAGRNLVDWYRLFCGVGLSTPVNDYWNPRGEMLAPTLLALALAGLALSWRALGVGHALFLLMLFASGSLPSILTNNVHAGRVLLALPVMLYWAALGAVSAVAWVGALLGRRAATGALLSLLAYSGFHAYASFVLPLGAREYPNRAHLPALAAAATPHAEVRILLSDATLDAPALQLFLFRTHRLLLGQQPLIPAGRGPQPGAGKAWVTVGECGQFRSSYAIPGAGPIFARQECAQAWEDVEIVPVPGAGDYARIELIVRAGPSDPTASR